MITRPPTSGSFKPANRAAAGRRGSPRTIRAADGTALSEVTKARSVERLTGWLDDPNVDIAMRAATILLCAANRLPVAKMLVEIRRVQAVVMALSESEQQRFVEVVSRSDRCAGR